MRGHIEFATNAHGQIDFSRGWNLGLTISPNFASAFNYLNSEFCGSSICLYAGTSIDQSYQYDAQVLTGSGFILNNPGKWTETSIGKTPLPATLPLFATGLGALGWLGRRRKRKAAKEGFVIG